MPKILDLGFSLAPGWSAYDTTTLAPLTPYQDIRCRNLTVTGTAAITGVTTATGGVSSAAQAGFVLGPFGAAAGNTGELRFLELAAGGTNYVGFKAADALAGNTIYTLPDAFPGSNMLLQSTSAGVLSWVAGGGANTALSNLAAVAINTTLVSDTDVTDDLGTAGVRWNVLYAATVDCSGAADTIGASLDATTGVRLGSAKLIAFSSTTAFDGAADVGLARDAAGIARVTDGSTGAGRLRLVLGSTASPSLSCFTDTDTGINLPGSDTVDIITGNAIFARISTNTMRMPSGAYLGWTSGVASSGEDTALYRVSANLLGMCGSSTTAAAGFQPAQSANAATVQILSASESLTLSTSGTTTDTTANLLPAGAMILTVVARVTTTITTATDWQLGDPTTAGRFTTANSTMTAGTTDIGRVHMTTGVASATTGMYQSAAAKVRVTTTGTPGAGVVRITVFYFLLTPPTS